MSDADGVSSASTFRPPFDAADDVVPLLRTRGYVVLAPVDTSRLAEAPITSLDAMRSSWDELAPDEYLKDGGRYRRRRHACFVDDAGTLRRVAHRAHWQPVEYNALHGGMHRWFEPMCDETVAMPAWARLVRGIGAVCASASGLSRWYVEAHQFRIDTANGIGRPTPEGAHRDGVDFVAVLLVERRGVKGGETRVFAADGPDGRRFTMSEPWTLLLIDDARVIHETTPIQPLASDVPNGVRDTLVLTYRAAGFQGDGSVATQ